MIPSNRRGHLDRRYGKHNTLSSGAIIYSVDYFSIFFNSADCYLISHNHRKLDFVFYSFEKHSFKFHDNVTTIAGTVTGLLQNNDVKDGRGASVTDFLFLSGGLTTEQGTLSCVASSSKCNWVSFNCDRTRLEANESHSCLEVILAKMIR